MGPGPRPLNPMRNTATPRRWARRDCPSASPSHRRARIPRWVECASGVFRRIRPLGLRPVWAVGPGRRDRGEQEQKHGNRGNPLHCVTSRRYSIPAFTPRRLYREKCSILFPAPHRPPRHPKKYKGAPTRSRFRDPDQGAQGTALGRRPISGRFGPSTTSVARASTAQVGRFSEGRYLTQTRQFRLSGFISFSLVFRLHVPGNLSGY